MKKESFSFAIILLLTITVFLFSNITQAKAQCELSDVDSDIDGICDDFDNCPETANPGQEDIDRDWVGDVCDDDMDWDYILNENDNCPKKANHKQQDTDIDGTGDACEADTIYGTISGNVQESITVDLYIVNCGGNIDGGSAITNAEGYYAVGDLPSGRYLVVPDDAGYSFSNPKWVDIPQAEIQSYDFTVKASCDNPDENTVNLSVIGEGYFMVKDVEGNEGINYTKSSCFSLNQENLLVNSQGYVLQGWALVPTSGERIGALSNIWLQEQSLIETVSSDGVISVKLVDETILPASQIGLAIFEYPENLQDEGNGLYTSNEESGQPTINIPAMGSCGEMVTGIIISDTF
jgi:hypothetical protein